MYRTSVYIEGERLDLFKDETISVVSSVQNIEDISRTFNDYSQSFTVPASPNNNRIFKHWYNFNINGGFDARVRHRALIDIQDSNFKVGTIRLESCEIEDNKPKHYKLTFFGLLIDLKKTIGDDYLSALDFSAYDIDYTPANIQAALTTGLFGGDYIVPLISTKRQWFYNSAADVHTSEEKLVNIHYHAGGGHSAHGIEWTNLRPAISIMAIIEAIEARYGLTFSRDFIGTAPFNGLYLWMANQESEDAVKNFYRVLNYDAWVTSQAAIGSFDNATGAYTPTTSGAGKIREMIAIVESSDGVLYTVQMMNGDTVLEEKSGTGDITIVRQIVGGFEAGASLYLRIVTSTIKVIDSCLFQVDELSNDQVLGALKVDFTIEGSTARTEDFIPKIKVMDFIKSLMKAYNMIVVPNSETDFYMDTLNEWYAKGQTYDISPYIDTSKMVSDRPKIFREISFKFQEPQTILADEFARANSTAYGDLETKLSNADGTPLDGEEFEIEVDFEQMVYEKLLDLNTNNETNIVYGLATDRGIDGVIPEPHIFYARQVSVSATPLSLLDDTGAQIQLNGNVYMPSHADSAAHNYSTAFGAEIDEHTGGAINNSLYKLWYDDYIKDTFSIKRRKVSVDALLPLWLLTTLKLNDRLIINGDRFIINEMTTNVTNRRVSFELLNDIFGVEGDIEVQEEVPPPVVRPTPTPTQGTSFSISGIGYPSPYTACEDVPVITKYWLGTEGQPTLADIVYNDINRTQPFNGQGLYYKIQGRAIRITSTGTVIDVFDCTAQANQ